MTFKYRQIHILGWGALIVLVMIIGVWIFKTPNSAEKKILHIALFQAPASMALKNQIAEFEREENVTVDVQILAYADLSSKFDQQVLTHSNGYDVVMIDSVLIPSYAAKGALAKLDESAFQTPDYDSEDVMPALADYLGRYPAKGALYGVPFMSNTHMMAYRPSQMENAARKLGIDLPGTTVATAWTWADYARVAHAVTNAGSGKIFGTSLQARPGAWVVYEWYSVLFAFDKNDADRATGLPDFNGSGVVAAKYYADLYTATAKSALTWGHEEETKAMCSGLTAMDATSNVELAANLVKPECDEGRGPIKFGFPPKSESGRSSPDMGGYGLFVSSTSPNRVLAQEFLKWATSKKVHLNVVLNGGSPIRLSELANADVVQKFPYLKFYGPLIATSVYRARIPQWPEMQDEISRHLTDVMTGQDTAEHAMGAVEAWVTQTLHLPTPADASANPH